MFSSKNALPGAEFDMFFRDETRLTTNGNPSLEEYWKKKIKCGAGTQRGSFIYNYAK